jgi:hypothetical protein
VIASTPQERDEGIRFVGECEKVMRDCPRIVAWLAACVKETVAATSAMEGPALYRECGARRDMQTILDTIAKPPTPSEGKADQGGVQAGW